MAASRDGARPPRLSRRSLVVAGGVGLAALFAGPRGRASQARASPFGPLVPDPAGILDLPAGYTYRILERSGDRMDDGYTVPWNPDGMAAFAGSGDTVILMRNHELLVGDGPYVPGAAPPEAFDPLAMGAVTRVVLDRLTLERVTSNLVLCGTLVNCAGGATPWGWLSCEENVTAGHGYVFLCDPAAYKVQAPRRIGAYGRCRHEAACVDPATSIAYLTEDQPDSSFYRLVPDDPADPFTGRLQALRVNGRPRFDTSAMMPGQRLAIEWIDLDDVDPVGDTLRLEAQTKGAAIVARGEGITFADGEIYVVSTSGGPIGKGQIFRIVDAPGAATLELVVQAVDPEVMQAPDNLTMAPWGELLFAEDNVGTNYIRGVTRGGAVFDFARNVLSTSELSGLCFSPDGKALFVNIYRQGLTLVITGPFPEAPIESPPAEEPATSGADPPTSEGEGEGEGEGEASDEGCGCRGDAGVSGVGAAVAFAATLASERRRGDDEPE
ncbi:MAG: DUF839 domain-containing protein [Nannocystaceae bacterium]